MRLVILGAGGHAQVIADAFQAMVRAGQAEGVVVAFLDDNPALHGAEALGIPVAGALADLPSVEHDAILIGIGDNAMRRRLFEQWLARGESFAAVVHPAAVIAPGVTIGEGSLIAAGVVVNTGSALGRNTILNTACSVDHHNRIGDHAHIAPGARLGGDVTIGEGALIGIGAIVMPQRNAGAWSVVGAGSLVHRSVAGGQTVVGAPARPLTDARSGFFTLSG